MKYFFGVVSLILSLFGIAGMLGGAYLCDQGELAREYVLLLPFACAIAAMLALVFAWLGEPHEH